MKESLKKLVRSRLTWAGHVERIGDEKLAKRADRCPESGEENEARKTEIATRDCIGRNLERVGEEWRKRAVDRRYWRLLIQNVVGQK